MSATETPAVTHLRSLKSIRERCTLLLSHPENLCHFDVDLGAVDSVVNMVLMLVLRDYTSPAEIPPHSRWRHLETPGGAGGAQTRRVDRLGPLIAAWDAEGAAREAAGGEPARYETVRRLLDLFVVSVLLDAGAGSRWMYRPKASSSGEIEQGVGRSEGLALAAFEWFLSGGLSSDKAGDPHRVDAAGLAAVTPEALAAAFQVDEAKNPLVGVEGRAALLQRLGAACAAQPAIFGKPGSEGSTATTKGNLTRPGHLLDYLLGHATTRKEAGDGATGSPMAGHVVQMGVLWDVVVRGLSGVWPAGRTVLDGVSLGDVWPCEALAKTLKQRSSDADVKKAALGGEADALGLLPLHKLTQWLAYSLVEPLGRAGVAISGAESLTALAEYRNGGLLVDAGVLALRRGSLGSHGTSGAPRLPPGHAAVVEWRALTVALIDVVAVRIRERLGLSLDALPLPAVLEAGTWKAGRELAQRLRPDSCGPPIEVVSDGTLF